jgi:energy-coupling factor transporter transmembrane protein EcfT
VAAVAGIVLALALPGWGPAAVVAASLVAWLAARRLSALVRVLLALAPVIASTILVNALLPADGGRTFGLQAAVRLLAVALPPSLLFITTRTDRLLVDLERRGLPPGSAFVAGTALSALPETLERARRVVDALRARGFDTEGSIGTRLRGIPPLTQAIVQGLLAEVEDRSLALEVRGFRRVRRRTFLDPPTDTPGEGLLRLCLLALAVGGIAYRFWLR